MRKQFCQALTVTTVCGLNLSATDSTIEPDRTEAMSGNGANYRGAQTKTRSGEDCQKWSAQTPNRHSQNIPPMPEADLTENFCRNPDNDVSIWCYTMNPNKMWDFCDPIVNEALTGNGADYRGAQTKTQSGLECLKWTDQKPKAHHFTPANYPDSGLWHNECRNPNGGSRYIWCYTTNWKGWEHCHPIGFDGHADSEFMTGDGKDYRGAQNKTMGDENCLPWYKIEEANYKFQPSKFPSIDLNDNLCRNPNGRFTIWCYVKHPKPFRLARHRHHLRARKEYCNPLSW